MNLADQTNQTNQTDEDVTLFDYWQVVAARWMSIGVFCTMVVLVTMGVSFLLPKIFESTATLLPQLESNEGLGLGALLASSGAGTAAQSLGISLPGAPATPTDIFIAMLKSRVMANELAEAFTGWEILLSRHEEFPAPENTVKKFHTSLHGVSPSEASAPRRRDAASSSGSSAR